MGYERGRNDDRYYYCEQSGHTTKVCPEKENAKVKFTKKLNNDRKDT